MPTLDVTDVKIASFSIDTQVTYPDTTTYLAIANLRYGIPRGVDSIEVNQADPVMCQTHGVFSIFNTLFQVFTVTEVRTPT